MQENLLIDGNHFEGFRVSTPRATLLLITAPRGFLGCGYINCQAAANLGDAAAIVRGVKNFDDMLKATVAEVSPAAAELGVAVGMTGREALLRMA